MVSNLLQSLLVPVIVVIGLIVLVALHDVAATVAIPVIVGFAGVHLGANLLPTTTTGVTTTPTDKPPIV